MTILLTKNPSNNILGAPEIMVVHNPYSKENLAKEKAPTKPENSFNIDLKTEAREIENEDPLPTTTDDIDSNTREAKVPADCLPNDDNGSDSDSSDTTEPPCPFHERNKEDDHLMKAGRIKQDVEHIFIRFSRCL